MEILQLADMEMRTAARKAAQVLAKGGIIVYPTDTLYGLGVDASSPEALKKLRIFKGREEKKPISLVVPGVESIETYAVVNDAARRLIKEFMPGPITLVLPAKGLYSTMNIDGSIGIRVPNSVFTKALAEEFGKPFTATSANKSGRENPSTIQEVIQQFGTDAHNLDMVIDGRAHPTGVGSTVVSCMTEMPHIIREGAISSAEIQLTIY